MLILAFETTAKACSAALHDGRALLAESVQNCFKFCITWEVGAHPHSMGVNQYT